MYSISYFYCGSLLSQKVVNITHLHVSRTVGLSAVVIGLPPLYWLFPVRHLFLATAESPVYSPTSPPCRSLGTQKFCSWFESASGVTSHRSCAPKVPPGDLYGATPRQSKELQVGLVCCSRAFIAPVLQTHHALTTNHCRLLCCITVIHSRLPTSFTGALNVYDRVGF